MHSYTRRTTVSLFVVGLMAVGGCEDTEGPDTALNVRDTGLTVTQVAGTYTLQTYNGESPPIVLRSTYAGTFVDDAGFWIPAPITIDDGGLLTLQTYYTVTFLGPKDPPGTYTAYPPDQWIGPGIPVFSGSVVIDADGTCAVAFWKNTSVGTCRFTQDLLEWTSARLVLTGAGTWTAKLTQRAVPGSTTTYREAGTFRIHDSQIVFTPAFLHPEPDCTATAAISGDILTAALQCQGIARPHDTSVWQR